jgi:cytochrome c biogenesis protein CcdA/thiol-disulfide isomerase/thioredoxin
MILLVISFLAGILTILAPCVLPLLPIIVGGSVSGDIKEKSRPYIIAGSLAAAIVVFTLILKVSTVLVNVSPDVLTDISGGLIILLGAVAVVPELWERIVIAFNWQAASQRFLGRGEQNKGKYIGPVLIGIALGPVFASCSPTYAFILASVLPHSLVSGLVYLIAYSLGLVLALLVVSLAGRKYIRRFPWAVDTHSLFRRLIGVLFIFIGIAIISGQEVKIETWTANHLPFDETRLEQVLLSKQHHSSVVQSTSKPSSEDSISSPVFNVQPTVAPEFVGLTNWINSPPLTIAGLQGKVVLVDFWTYSCINCIRSIPYVEKWYQTYKNDGLVVVGISTPEFAFEHNPNNVRAAVKRDGITYPVALDNSYDTWDAYDNDSWPADYLIDRGGYIRYVSLGEGDYATTEQAIQALLKISKPLQTPTSNVPISQNQTPETYFGSNRRSGFSGNVSSYANADGSYTYTPTPSSQLQTNAWTLSGNWQTAPQYITSEGNNTIVSFNVTAKDVYVVASSSDGHTHNVSVELPGAYKDEYGSDASNGTVTIDGSRLYHIVSFKKLTTTVVTLIVPKGVSLYTFTFGS